MEGFPDLSPHLVRACQVKAVARLPLGRQALRVTGKRVNAPNTFRTKTDASRWLTRVEADISRGTWLDEDLGRQAFGEYARAYLRDNPKIGPRWRETCLRNLRLHMTALEEMPLAGITPPIAREWYAAALRGKGGRTSIQQSCRFLRAVMNSALRDGAIRASPCNIPGAGSDRAKERPVASVVQVAALIEAITPRYRAAVLLGAWCGMRRGEIIALKPEDIDLKAATVTVHENRVELLESPVAFDAPPKTDAGKRTVTVPPHVLPILEAHMKDWAGRDRVFVGRDGKPMRGDAVRQAFARARAKVDVPGFRFHDLRHTGQTLAASAGATLKDLMLRLGHASPVAAQRYLHVVEGRDAEIASALSDLAAHGNAARLPKSIVVKH